MAHIEHTDLIEAILIEISKTPNTRVLLEADRSYDGQEQQTHDFHYNLSNEEHLLRCNYNKKKAIWFVDSLNSFLRLESHLINERNHFHRNAYFSIIYTGREANRLKIVHEIFLRLLRIYVININVFITVGPTIFVYTYFPFTETKCHSAEPHFHGIFGPTTNYEYSRKEFFPKKLLNMWGCKVNVTTRTSLPFVDLDYDRATGDVIKLEGIEGMLLGLLAKRMNFTIRIVEEPENRAGDGSDPGAIKMLIDGLTNLTIGCLILEKARSDVVLGSYAYMYVPLNLAIPLGKMMTPLERLIRPFKYIIWSCLSSSALFGIFIIFILKAFCNQTVQEFIFGHNNRIPFTNLWSVFYGGPIYSALPRRNFARYLLGVWLFYTFILRSAYLAQLFLILQDSRARSALKTVNETLQQNFTFYAYGVTVPVLIGAATENISIKRLDTNSIPDLFETLGKDEDAKIAVTVLNYVVYAYNHNPENYNHQVNVLRDPVFIAPVSLYMRKHSYLAREINSIILNMMSAGLINKFELHSLNQGVPLISRGEIFHSIPLFLLIGLFLVHFVLLLLTILVFFLEIWTKYSPLTKRVIEFFNN